MKSTFKIVSSLAFAALAAGAAASATEGWDNINPERKEFPVQKVLWTADFTKAKMDLRDGAEGSMRVVERDGRKALEIVKTNDRGMIVVTAPPFQVEKGAKLRTYAYCQCEDGDPETGEGYLRLYGRKEDLSYYKALDGRGPGGPRMQKMVNAPPGGSIRKLAHRLADEKTGTSITAAIVVSGPPCTSVWHDWGVEDKNASDKAWKAYRRSLEPPDMTFGMIPADEFNRSLAADIDHTAKVEKRDGYSRLVIDGKVVPPMVFRGQTAKNGKITYAGGIHDRNGVRLQSMSIQFCKCERHPQGIWSRDRFDAKAGADIVRTTMRLAPNSVFFLTLRLDAYPEWVEDHPGEEWLLADGRKVHGNAVHADFHVRNPPPKGKWLWPSYHSLVLRKEMKDRISELVAELRRQGLSKRIVGVHMAGYHDAQFSTRHPDFSKPAVAAFVRWQKEHYGKVRWTTAPAFGKKPVLDPAEDTHQVAYLKFVKQGPFHMQEDLARHIRKCFGKEMVIGRYCMGWGAAAFNNALDLHPFVKSDAVDYLVAQPSYSHRTPGVAVGSRIPTRTFHDYGKLYINEFDLRTYGGVHGGEVELRVLGLSQATDFPMWQSIHHKMAGQMLAQRMGWWYLDMSGKWFSPPEIARDIVETRSVMLDAESCDSQGWMPSAAIAIDEQGMLMRNSIGNYYSAPDRALQDMIRSFAASGTPYETCMADDLALNPERGERYKVVFFANLDMTDPSRRRLLEHLRRKAVKCVMLSADKRITPREFSGIVRDAGGYVPASYGLQVDMNGNFISVHALRSGRYEFSFPRRCAVRNMKTGKMSPPADSMELHMTAGETRWYRMLPSCGKASSAAGGSLDNVVHRGWGLDWPHNALVSIRKCWKEGFVPEVDARLCKERKIFALHDLNGNYDLKNVPWSEIAALDVGVKRGKQWKGERPPLWEDIMAEMEGHPERKLLVDLKDATPEMIVEMAKRHGVERQLICLSSNSDTLKKWKRLLPGVETRFVVHPGIWTTRFLEGAPAEKMRETVKKRFARVEADGFEGIDTVKFVVRVDPSRKDPFSLGRELLKDMFARVHAAGKKVGVWVWSGGMHKESYRLLREMGVDNFGTDYPETMQEFLKEERQCVRGSRE